MVKTNKKQMKVRCDWRFYLNTWFWLNKLFSLILQIISFYCFDCFVIQQIRERDFNFDEPQNSCHSSLPFATRVLNEYLFSLHIQWYKYIYTWIHRYTCMCARINKTPVTCSLCFHFSCQNSSFYFQSNNLIWGSIIKVRR